MASRSSWFVLAIQSVAVMLSILAAFAIDAWWQEQNEQEELVAALEVVLDEIDENMKSIAMDRRHNNARMDSIVALFKTSTNPNGSGSYATFDRHLMDALITGNDKPVSTASIEALIESGLMSEIESQDLKSDLAAWPGKLARRQVWMKSEGPELAAFILIHGNMEQLEQYISVPGLPEVAIKSFPLATDHGRDHTLLLADQHFRNALVKKWGTIADANDALIWLESAMAETEKMIKAELTR